MIIFAKIVFCVFALSYVEAIDSMEKIPFENSKVIYHKQSLCIFRPDKPKCYGSEKMPGDPSEIAHLYEVQKKIQNLPKW